MKKIEFSDFGKKLCGESGILQLMDDLGKPLPKGIKSYQLGGGNPAQISQIEKLYRTQMQKILSNDDEFENLIGRYDSPQGRISFIENLVEFFSNKFGWKISVKNIAITNGSQSAFFYLFNLFSGTFSDSGKKKTIVCPLVPEYIGYADQGLEKDTFVGIPAKYVELENHTFKYNIDFECLENYLKTHDNVGALCVSRPTNPTGNVLTNDEINKLSDLSKMYDIPLMVDNAYGLPWPSIIFDDNAIPYWDQNVILSMSLSKIGLPSLRTGIIIADEKIVKALSNLNAIIALASGSVGQAIAGDLIKSGKLVQSAKSFVKPFYQQKSLEAQNSIHKYFTDSDYLIHKSEGSIFLWLVLNDLRITTKEFYQKLKQKGVIVVPGEYFFFGNTIDNSLPKVEEHIHYSKCIRLNYSRPKEEVDEGIKIISEVYRQFRK